MKKSKLNKHESCVILSGSYHSKISIIYIRVSSFFFFPIFRWFQVNYLIHLCLFHAIDTNKTENVVHIHINNFEIIDYIKKLKCHIIYRQFQHFFSVYMCAESSICLFWFHSARSFFTTAGIKTIVSQRISRTEFTNNSKVWRRFFQSKNKTVIMFDVERNCLFQAFKWLVKRSRLRQHFFNVLKCHDRDDWNKQKIVDKILNVFHFVIMTPVCYLCDSNSKCTFLFSTVTVTQFQHFTLLISKKPEKYFR